MRPVGDVVLDDAGDAGGARRVAQVVLAGEVEDGVVRIESCPSAETGRGREARVASRWKDSVSVCTAICAAISP
jgi:hypothetical protein